jgi:uncharacterized protein (TIGR02678 family)
VRVQGDEEQFLTERGDVLYNVQRAALTRMLSVYRGPSMVVATEPDARIAALLDEPGPNNEDARNRRIRHRLVRRLLDDPFVLFDEIDPEERAYLQRQRTFLAEEIREATDLLPEVRREGIAMVDDRNELSDVVMPEDGTEGHVTLLLAEFLAAHARRGPLPVPIEAIHEHIAALVGLHGRFWRADARLPGAEVHLARSALERLAALRLVRRTPEGAIPQPPIARYAVASRAGMPNARADRTDLDKNTL